MIPLFLGANSRRPLPGKPALLGVPFDGTASFRKGTAAAPNELRQISEDAIETFSPRLNGDLEEFPFADLGDLSIPEKANAQDVVDLLFAKTRSLFDLDVKPLIVGGEHSISSGAIQAAFEKHPDLHVLQFDAHADLRQDYEGDSHSHACAMRRVLDVLPSRQLLQIGIRSGTADEFAELHQTNRLLPATTDALRPRLPAPGTPIWITFDVDVFDPSECPGTGTPEAGGLTYREWEPILDLLTPHRLIGADLVELAPILDSTGITGALGAKLIREFLILLGTKV